MREAARLKSSSFPHPAPDADIVATIDTVVTVAAIAAYIAINATGNIAAATTALGTAAAATTTNLCYEFDGYKFEQLCL